jgi:hypothetical protein
LDPHRVGLRDLGSGMLFNLAIFAARVLIRRDERGSRRQ